MMGGFGFAFGMLFWLVIIVSIIAIAVWLWSNPGGTDKVVGKDALEILEERYARGEIDKSAFLERKRKLEN
jgi:putative membrane protein